jgi:methionine-R-sulfoxide reductase
MRKWVYGAMTASLVCFSTLRAPGQDAIPSSNNSADARDPAAAGKSSTAKDGAKKAEAKAKAKQEPEFVFKTDAEWRKILSRVQYSVTRQKATEPAFSGKYATGHFRGTFLCICCDAELFNAQNKFDSGTGWPSFDRPANAKALVREMDYSAFEPRVEVNCRRCGAHLGHVFDDGPTITGLRFCINSVSIKLKSPDAEPAASKASSRTTNASKTSAKTKSKARPKSKTKSTSKAKSTLPPGDSADSPDSPNNDRPSGNSTAKPSGDTATP